MERATGLKNIGKDLKKEMIVNQEQEVTGGGKSDDASKEGKKVQTQSEDATSESVAKESLKNESERKAQERNHQLVWDESKIQASIFVPQMLMTFFFSHWRMSKPLIPSDGCTAARLRHAEALTVTGFPQLGGR